MTPEKYNAGALIDANLEDGRGEKTAIYFGDERITYNDLFNRVCAMGGALRTLGAARENRVLLILGDTPAFPVAFFGAMRIGAVPVVDGERLVGIFSERYVMTRGVATNRDPHGSHSRDHIVHARPDRTSQGVGQR